MKHPVQQFTDALIKQLKKKIKHNTVAIKRFSKAGDYGICTYLQEQNVGIEDTIEDIHVLCYDVVNTEEEKRVKKEKYKEEVRKIFEERKQLLQKKNRKTLRRKKIDINDVVIQKTDMKPLQRYSDTTKRGGGLY